MAFGFKKKPKKKFNPNIRPIDVALVNDNVVTTESVVLALDRMDSEKMGLEIARIEEIPFPRKLMQYISKYRLDLVIIDAQMEDQDINLYIQKVKNFDKSIKVVVLAKLITPEIEELYNKYYIDEYITLPFQDANLWNAIYKAFNDDRSIKRGKKDTIPTLEELEKEIIKEEEDYIQKRKKEEKKLKDNTSTNLEKNSENFLNLEMEDADDDDDLDLNLEIRDEKKEDSQSDNTIDLEDDEFDFSPVYKNRENDLSLNNNSSFDEKMDLDMKSNKTSYNQKKSDFSVENPKKENVFEYAKRMREQRSNGSN